MDMLSEHGMQCPDCGQVKAFLMEVTHTMKITPSYVGVESVRDKITDDNPAMCEGPDCGTWQTVGYFKAKKEHPSRMDEAVKRLDALKLDFAKALRTSEGDLEKVYERIRKTRKLIEALEIDAAWGDSAQHIADQDARIRGLKAALASVEGKETIRYIVEQDAHIAEQDAKIERLTQECGKAIELAHRIINAPDGETWKGKAGDLIAMITAKK